MHKFYQTSGLVVIRFGLIDYNLNDLLFDVSTIFGIRMVSLFDLIISCAMQFG
jgi:hypothetical protein